MTRRFLAGTLCTICIWGPAIAGTNGSIGNEGWMKRAELASIMAPQMSDPAPVHAPIQVKKPAVGILLSAVVPGAGELYAGSWVKGAVLMGLEAAFWIGYVQFKNKGNDIEDEYHLYADTHWSETRWLENYDDTHGSTHSLPGRKTQQYYEMIGKYDQFMSGWDDWVAGGPVLTTNRLFYEGVRDDSNVQFIRASYCVMLSMANRLFSVFDTAFTIRGINRRATANVRMGLNERAQETVPMMALNLNW